MVLSWQFQKAVLRGGEHWEVSAGFREGNSQTPTPHASCPHTQAWLYATLSNGLTKAMLGADSSVLVKQAAQAAFYRWVGIWGVGRGVLTTQARVLRTGIWGQSQPSLTFEAGSLFDSSFKADFLPPQQSHTEGVQLSSL